MGAACAAGWRGLGGGAFPATGLHGPGILSILMAGMQGAGAPPGSRADLALAGDNMQTRIGAMLVALAFAAPTLAQTSAQPAKPAGETTTKLWKIECTGMGG
jgi:hypothetical protein